jgi:hypothetical protein
MEEFSKSRREVRKYSYIRNTVMDTKSRGFRTSSPVKCKNYLFRNIFGNRFRRITHHADNSYP